MTGLVVSATTLAVTASGSSAAETTPETTSARRPAEARTVASADRHAARIRSPFARPGRTSPSESAPLGSDASARRDAPPLPPAAPADPPPPPARPAGAPVGPGPRGTAPPGTGSSQATASDAGTSDTGSSSAASSDTGASGAGSVPPGTLPEGIPESRRVDHGFATDVLRANGIRWRSTGGCSDRAVATCTSFERIRWGTIKGLVRFARSSGCAIVVTGGTERGHASGPYSHANGYKADIALSECADRAIERYPFAGVRGDGSRLYRSPDGALFARERDHWDITFR